MSEPVQHPWSTATRRLQVDDILIDLRYRRVIAPGQETELPQRMFDLLLVFLAEPQVLHSRAELFARVWPGVIVEDANLSQSVWMLRKALGESRKHWIRTVAKSGYVFEPPGAVTALAEPPPAAGTIPTPRPATPAHAPSARPPASPWRRRTAWGALALLAVVAIGALAGRLHDGGRDTGAAASPAPELAIVLIDIEDAAAPATTRWPVTLLHAWLGWKLESLPEVTLLTEAHLAADSAGRSPRIVFLSSGTDSGNPGRVFLRARFDLDGRETRLERTGTPAELPRMADRLSQELLATLVPARADAPWPRLTLDTATARRYSEAVEALERRDWVAGARILGEVSERAPEFGLAHLQLGRVLTRLAHAAPAIEHTQAALQRLQPVADDVAAVLRAERLACDPARVGEAAAAYAELTRRHPGKTAYALDQARMLRRAGQYKEALAILNQPHWERTTVGDRLDQQLNLAAAYLAMGDAVRAREHAHAADSIASAAGKGWEQERGDALLLAAQIDRLQYQANADPAGFEQAARQFELAGDDMYALIARFLAESTKPGRASAMDALLRQARERGYRRLETDILRVAAFRHYGEGNLPAYRALLEQALATALAAGDTREQHLLDLDLLNEDFLRGRFDAADRRLGRLRAAGLQGTAAVRVALFDALVAANRGQFALAEAILDKAEARDREANPGAAVSTSLSRIACLRADLRLVQGDLPRARAEWKSCAASGQPSAREQSRLGNAYVDLLAGDRAAALRQLREPGAPGADTRDGPDRWLTELTQAMQLTRAGEPDTAQRLYERMLPLARQSDYRWIVAIAEAGLAETAATRGDWTAVRRHVDAARRGHVAGMWTLSNRLDVLEAIAAMAGGDGRHAWQLLSAVYASARRNHDAVTQLEIQSLLPPGTTIGECDPRCQAALIARTGLRGATLDWLTAPSRLDTGVLAAAVR